MGNAVYAEPADDLGVVTVAAIDGHEVHFVLVSVSVDLGVERWVIISMMVMCDATVITDHYRGCSRLPSALVVIEYDNSITENSQLTYRDSSCLMVGARALQLSHHGA